MAGDGAREKEREIKKGREGGRWRGDRRGSSCCCVTTLHESRWGREEGERGTFTPRLAGVAAVAVAVAAGSHKKEGVKGLGVPGWYLICHENLQECSFSIFR